MKVLVVAAHPDDEIREFPHPCSPKALETIAKTWGLTVGMDCVEPFVLVRELQP